MKTSRRALPSWRSKHMLCSSGCDGDSHQFDCASLGKPSEMSDNTSPDDPNQETGVVTRTRPKTKKPSLYRVLILNDDYTPMEFVVMILEHFFSKTREEATKIMLHVHNNGVGLCGVFTYEVAETKVAQVLDVARRHEHPLQCTMERDD